MKIESSGKMEKIIENGKIIRKWKNESSGK
jgi:hypothetical protein